MQPDRSIPEDDDSQQLPLAASESSSATPVAAGPLENLQRRYSDQLSQDIGRLEAEKDQLQADITALRIDYDRLSNEMRLLQASIEATRHEADAQAVDNRAAVSGPRLPGEPVAGPAEPNEHRSAEPRFTESELAEQALDDLPALMPLLPGESTAPRAAVSTVPTPEHSSVALPIPSTSEQRRLRQSQRQQMRASFGQSQRTKQADDRKGLVLSAIATLLMAFQFCLIYSISQGGNWLGVVSIGELGVGFMPAVALLWLRMLVTVPALVLLAPQLYADTWLDLQDWMYRGGESDSEGSSLTLLVGSGVALFFSQVFIYQCVGSVGPVVGATLLFLYPLVAIPLGFLFGKARSPTPLGLVALIAIAMGGILTIKPAITATETPATLWLGILASVAFSVYIVLTNISYQRQCHPIPVGLVQFSTVAVLSSIVLLAKPIEPVNIEWLSFALWGILIGVSMLLVYLFNYSSLRLMGARTAIVAAAVPLMTLLLAWSFTPMPSLAVIQWTGILLVTIGGIALNREKLGISKS